MPGEEYESTEVEEVVPTEEVLEGSDYAWGLGAGTIRAVDDLEFERSRTERGKISIVETIIILMMTVSADAFEVLAGLIAEVPIVGQIVWFLAFVFGLLISGIVLLWAFFRGVRGILLIRMLIVLVGIVLDIATLGFLPTRTIATAIAIWLNNRYASKKVKEILNKIEEVNKVLLKWA